MIKLDTVAGAAKTYRIVQKLTVGESPTKTKDKPKQHRKSYFNKELVEISSHISQAIATQTSISLAQAREFLDKNKVVRRTPIQVQDKVASIIRTNQADGYRPAVVD